MIFDSHAHYDSEMFNEDRNDVIDKINKAGVTRVLNCAANLKGCEDTLSLTSKHDFFYGALGVHPHDAEELLGGINILGDMFGKSDKILAVGEIGLDYYYDISDREIQKKIFREQMVLARDLNLPVVIHDRDAHEDTLKILKEFKSVKGVLHCYSGSPEFAKEVLKLDYYLGFTGVITFKNARKSLEVLEQTPLDRILVETDCPYLTPVPNRGKRNDSSYLIHTLNVMAKTIGKTYNETCQLTFENASNLFGLK
ncbi:TatD family hydrolase [Clostridium cylindrosporum]|uniref:Hydrolase, TatD family n=1 Tax=Clostridium cylindrosporum DSM 605 TaxID=1121307 RepID=A0A0J8DAQ4_CLOCY|nr:TatD family hydrolase [Clostridium cylindrosporum]KMT22932.1 hydrolase, TatD family [Clostridium cylindrosporum DSM 605]